MFATRSVRPPMNSPFRLAQSAVNWHSAFAGAVAVVCLACGPAHTPPQDGAREAFEDLIGAPAPDRGVLDLRGDSSCGLDCTVWLRFRSDADTFERLAHTRLVTVPCAEMPPAFTHPPQATVFTPPWHPQISRASRCYRGERSLNSGRWLTWLVRNDETGVTHAFGGTFPKPVALLSPPSNPGMQRTRYARR